MHVGELFERVAQVVSRRVVLRDNHDTRRRILRMDRANVVDERIESRVSRFVAHAAVDSAPRRSQIGRVAPQCVETVAQRLGTAAGDLQQQITADIEFRGARSVQIFPCRTAALDVTVGRCQSDSLIDPLGKRVGVVASLGPDKTAIEAEALPDRTPATTVLSSGPYLSAASCSRSASILRISRSSACAMRSASGPIIDISSRRVAARWRFGVAVVTTTLGIARAALIKSRRTCAFRRGNSSIRSKSTRSGIIFLSLARTLGRTRRITRLPLAVAASPLSSARALPR